MDTPSKKLRKFHMRWPGHDKRKETLRETESALIAAQNNAIRTNYIEAKIDNTLRNS